MNILVFSWRDPKHPLAGGAEQVMHEHMKGWIEAGHEVTLFSSRFPGSAKEEVLDDVKIIRAGHQYLGVQWAGFLYYLESKDRYDFVVDQFHGLPFFTPLYVRKPKLAVIQETAREVWFLNPLPWPINWIVGIIGYLGEPVLFLFYRSITFMTGSDSAKENISKIGISTENIVVVPHGVIIKAPTPLPKKEKTATVMYLGVLSRDKGIEDALRCFAILKKKHEVSKFWVAGRTETKNYRDRIRSLVTELNLNKSIEFYGFVSQEKKFELLARAHILINPSIREGWGLVNIEANSVGTPVVAYESLGLVDSVKDGLSGLLCREKTPANLAENISRLLKDRKLYKHLKQGAKKWASKFSWDKSTKLSLRLIDNLSTT